MSASDQLLGSRRKHFREENVSKSQTAAFTFYYFSLSKGHIKTSDRKSRNQSRNYFPTSALKTFFLLKLQNIFFFESVSERLLRPAAWTSPSSLQTPRTSVTPRRTRGLRAAAAAPRAS
ncbi:hypothetical protein AMECASPLE_007609 [Ameca splendens]|uniref:Uncharacterized protein n=1 Tax=Ameca splendens TaxID=208324 RepID=A0ABV1A614_9TELE